MTRVPALVAFVLGAVSTVGFARQYQAAAQGPPPQGGPYTHRVMSASSTDGLTFTADKRVLIEHASVPCPIVTPEGTIRIYYVDASQIPETTNCAESTDGGVTFTVLGCTIAKLTALKAVDPSIVRLKDGRYRLYYYGSAENPGAAGSHSIYSAISSDGVAFTEEKAVFTYEGLVDPDVFQVRRSKWFMFVFGSAQATTLVAQSRNGTKFRYRKQLGLDGWGTTAPVKLDDGRFRLYAFNQRGQQTVGSFVSRDALTWAQEPGDRLTAPPGEEITDPQVVRLPDGTWKMFYKSSPKN